MKIENLKTEIESLLNAITRREFPNGVRVLRFSEMPPGTVPKIQMHGFSCRAIWGLDTEKPRPTIALKFTGRRRSAIFSTAVHETAHVIRIGKAPPAKNAGPKVAAQKMRKAVDDDQKMRLADSGSPSDLPPGVFREFQDHSLPFSRVAAHLFRRADWAGYRGLDRMFGGDRYAQLPPGEIGEFLEAELLFSDSFDLRDIESQPYPPGLQTATADAFSKVVDETLKVYLAASADTATKNAIRHFEKLIEEKRNKSLSR